MLFNLFIAIVTFAFIVRSIRLTLYHTYLWQLKEYRLDRFCSFLKTSPGRALIFSPPALIKWFLLFIIYDLSLYHIYVNPNALGNIFIIYAFYIFWIIWILELFLSVRDGFKKKWRVPKFTLKSVLIVFSVLTVLFSPMFTILWNSPLLLGPVLDKILAPLVVFFVLLLNLPVAFLKYLSFRAAFKKIKKLNPFVIGITGSFGKTSTKEFLAAILSAKYRVAKTPDSFNTDIAIAVYINKNLSAKDEFFIAEVGAYKRGEINKICQMIKPNAAVITGIGSQHLELFGSMANLQKAKYELIENLPSDGIAVINVNNSASQNIADLAKKKLKHVYEVSTTKDVKNIKVDKFELEFEFLFGNTRAKLKSGLIGSQNLDNLILAVKMANLLKVDRQTIVKRVSQLTVPNKTMRIIKKSRILTLIDDTFNVNYEGVMAALNYLKLYKGTKIMILNPIIELGEYGHKLHQEIGKVAGNICHYLFLTNPNFSADIKKGIDASSDKITKIIQPEKKQIAEILKNMTFDSAVIFAGKESEKWIKVFNEV